MLFTNMRCFTSSSRCHILRAVVTPTNNVLVDNVFAPMTKINDRYFHNHEPNDIIAPYNPIDNDPLNGPSLFSSEHPMSDRTGCAWFKLSSNAPRPKGITIKYDHHQQYIRHRVVCNNIPLPKNDCLHKIEEFGTNKNWQFLFTMPLIDNKWLEEPSLTRLIDKILQKIHPIVVNDSVYFKDISMQYKYQKNRNKIVALMSHNVDLFQMLKNSNPNIVEPIELVESIYRRASSTNDIVHNLESLLPQVLKRSDSEPGNIILPQSLLPELLDPDELDHFYEFPKPFPPLNTPHFALYGLFLRLYERELARFRRINSSKDIIDAVRCENIYETLCNIWKNVIQNGYYLAQNNLIMIEFNDILLHSNFSQRCLKDIETVQQLMNEEYRPNLHRYESLIQSIWYCLTVKALCRLSTPNETIYEGYFDHIQEQLRDGLSQKDMSDLTVSYHNYNSNLCDSLNAMCYDFGDEEDKPIKHSKVIEIAELYASHVEGLDNISLLH